MQERYEIEEEVGLYHFLDVDERIATTGLLSLDEIAEDVLNENNEENEDEAIEVIVPEVKPVTLKEAETCLESLRKYTQANTGTLSYSIRL
jgi:CBS domain containing-hemolysin-like protein